MKVILFGATGMVGQGVLRECLLAGDVESVLAVGRNTTGLKDEKLDELVPRDLYDLAPVGEKLGGYDACFFCAGVSAAGMSEKDYRRVTFDLTLSAARTLSVVNPSMTFIYVSGAGTGGRAMWARVKGETEKELLKLPFKAAYMFRPAFIRPMHGIKSRTRLYRAAYAAADPIFPILNRLIPAYVTTTEKVGRAMLQAVRRGAPQGILENDDINELADAV